MPNRILHATAALIGAATFASAAEPPWKVQDFLKAPATFPAESYGAPEGVKALTFEGPPYHGKPTKVFAYYGIPQNAEGPVPAMVLVHGGAGTSYPEWVKLWLDRGYAAIAFDHFGGLPVRAADGKWSRNPEGGPDQGGVWQMAWPVRDQWLYHAVADTLLATSLFASFPEVDADRIGLTGISWGGVVACIVAGLDDRLKFVAPIYGCGFVSDRATDGSQFVGHKDPPELLQKWRELWDPANYLPNARMPMLWVNGTNDFAFTPNVWQKSISAARGEQFASLQLRLVHGQKEGMSPREVAAMADAVLKGKPSLPRITAQGLQDGKAWAKFQSPLPVKEATLIYTRDDGKWQDRRWESAPAEVTVGGLSATLPDGSRAYTFQLIDERGLLVSGDLQTNL